MSITLTATAQDLTGAALGSAANPSKLTLMLCGYGPQIPRVAGTSLLARVVLTLSSPNGIFSTPVVGNDVITPAGTYYVIELLDQQGNVVQAGAYQLTGSGTFDLSNLLPILSPAQTVANPPFTVAGVPSVQQASGTINGINASFNFVAPATPTPVISVYAGGVYQTPGVDYGAPSFLGGTSWQVVLTTAPQFGPVSIALWAAIGTGTRTVTTAPTIVVSGANPDNTVFCNFSAPTSFAIPTAAAAGISYELVFKDTSGTAAANNITITCAGGIEAGSSYVINTNMGAVRLRSDGSVWRAVGRF